MDKYPLEKKTYTPKQIASNHKLPLSVIIKQLAKGIKVEQEHTSNIGTAREIALDHLNEIPNYYNKLKKMESE